MEDENPPVRRPRFTAIEIVVSLLAIYLVALRLTAESDNKLDWPGSLMRAIRILVSVGSIWRAINSKGDDAPIFMRVF